MNVDITYESPDGKWMVDLYVHNIEDKDIITGAFVGAQGKRRWLQPFHARTNERRYIHTI